MNAKWELIFLILASGHLSQAHGGNVNFDNLNPGTKLGGVLAASGVTFTTGQIPDNVAVNDIITISSAIHQFEILSNEDAISPPNFAVAYESTFGTADLDVLMSFASPVNFVSLYSDDSPT